MCSASRLAVISTTLVAKKSRFRTRLRCICFSNGRTTVKSPLRSYRTFGSSGEHQVAFPTTLAGKIFVSARFLLPKRALKTSYACHACPTSDIRNPAEINVTRGWVCGGKEISQYIVHPVGSLFSSKYEDSIRSLKLHWRF